MKIKFILIVLAVSIFSCTNLKGEFAFKTAHDETYKRAARDLEFSADEEIKWIYKIKRVSQRRKIGVIIMKKELTWIEINSVADYIDMSKKIIYGTIKDLDIGDYQIVLTDVIEKNRVFARQKFMIYSDDEEEI